MLPELSEHLQKPAVGVSCRGFTEFDQQAKCLTGYEQQYQQLSCGKFEGFFRTVLLGKEVGFYFEVLNQVLEQAGAVPDDRYLILFLMKENGCCKINGHTFHSNNVFYAGPGTQINGVSGPSANSVVININKKLFETVLGAMEPGLGHNLTLPRCGVVETNLSQAHGLRQLFRQVIDYQEINPTVFSRNRVITALCSSIAELITKHLVKIFRNSHEKGSIGFSRRFKIVRDACDFIHEKQVDNISITSICQQTGVSRRTLEYSFHDCLGQSPSVYLRNIKLNSIRRALLSPENANRSIGDIAAEFGVWHLSRFAQYYKKHFHELPSDTKKRVNP